MNMIITLAVDSSSEALVNALKTVSIAAFVLAGVFLSVSIVTFIVFKIPMVINDLSGRTAKRAITKRRNENEKSGIKSFRASPIAQERGKKTSVIKKGSTLTDKPKQTDINVTSVLENDFTEILKEENDVLYNAQATELLTEETAVLANAEATELLTAAEFLADATAVLSDETVVLSESLSSDKTYENPNFRIIQSIVLIHTKELI